MKYLLIFLAIFSLLNGREETEEITIKVEEGYSSYVGSKNGQFGFTTSTEDDKNFFDEKDIETNTHFDLSLNNSDATTTYRIDCRLWKNNLTKIFIFCEMVDQIRKDKEEFEIYKSITF